MRNSSRRLNLDEAPVQALGHETLGPRAKGHLGLGSVLRKTIPVNLKRVPEKQQKAVFSQSLWCRQRVPWKYIMAETQNRRCSKHGNIEEVNEYAFVLIHGPLAEGSQAAPEIVI